jgi:hypothetical protein
MDCFFDVSANPNALETALRWHAQNEFEGLGPGKRFSDSMPSRKLLWASYGDRNMGNVHDQYYPRAVYDRLVAIKRRVDPRPLFTPNAFCVGAPPTQPQPAAAEAAAAATLPVPVLQPADAFRRTMALASVPTKTFEASKHINNK